MGATMLMWTGYFLARARRRGLSPAGATGSAGRFGALNPTTGRSIRNQHAASPARHTPSVRGSASAKSLLIVGGNARV